MKKFKDDIYKTCRLSAKLNLYMSLCEPKQERVLNELNAINRKTEETIKKILENHKN